MTRQNITESDEREVLMMQMERIENELFIDPNEEIEHPPVSLSFGEHTMGGIVYPTPISTYGNLVFIQAPPKSTKTFFVSLLSAAYLGGNSKGYTKGINGHRDERCLIHFDTEQGRFHAQRVFKRVLRMTGLSNECYHTYGLRGLDYDKRVDFIDYCLSRRVNNPGLVVIDGVADLVSDVNDIQGSNGVIQKLMEWSQKYNCTILTVIHSNHGTDKATGHLGSALYKKCETAIQLKPNFDEGYIEVRCKEARNYPFDTFSYKIDDYGLPSVIDTDLVNFDTKKFE